VRSTFGLVALLVVMAVVLLLTARQTRRDVETVKSVTLATESDVVPAAFDAAAARKLVARLGALADQEQLPQDDLRAAADQAARWAAALSPGTSEYHLAVNLRAAADELRASSASLSDPHRARARRFLEQAQTGPGGPGGGPPGAVGAIRDQVQNLQQRHQEQIQDVEREHQ
jgi:hypothetical protein